MTLFSPLDLLALAGFVGAWFFYALVLEWTPHGRNGLNAKMDGFRDAWMLRMLEREMRMVDGQIMASLQNGTAFFASTSLLAIGGALTLLRLPDELLTVVASLPFGTPTSRVLWEVKTIGLVVIFIYAFFKFAWCYRLYNYVAIMIGAMPPWTDKDSADAREHAQRTGKLCESAGRHFNRGQRAFFFALAYLGWFVSPWLLMVTTVSVLIVMWQRQFTSEARAAMPSD